MTTKASDVGPGFVISIVEYKSYCAELLDAEGNVLGFADDQPTAEGAEREAIRAWRRAKHAHQPGNADGNIEPR